MVRKKIIKEIMSYVGKKVHKKKPVVKKPVTKKSTNPYSLADWKQGIKHKGKGYSRGGRIKKGITIIVDPKGRAKIKESVKQAKERGEKELEDFIKNLNPKKFQAGGLINPVIKGAIKRAKKQGKWPTKNPFAKDLKEAKKPKTTYHYLGKKRTDVPGQKIPVVAYKKTTESKHQKKIWAKMKKPAVQEGKVKKIMGALKETKIIPKIYRQITSPTRRYSKAIREAQKDKKTWKTMKGMQVGSEDAAGKVTHSSWVKHHAKEMKKAVGLKTPSKRLNKARQAINKLIQYQQKQRLKQTETLLSGLKKGAAQKGVHDNPILKEGLRQGEKLLKDYIKKAPKLRRGGLIKKPKSVRIAKRGWGKVIR